MVHAAPGETREDRLWTRPEKFDWSCVPEDTTCIIGHTPTCFITEDYSAMMSVYQGERYICIDCGCGHNEAICRLACLRLEDLEAVYV